MTDNEIYARAYSLGQEYCNFYVKLKNRYCNRDAFIKKYIKYFEETIRKFAVRDGYNNRKFLEAVFYGEGIKYPQQLPYENNWKKYTEYISNTRNNDIDEEREIVQKLISSCYILKKYNNVEDFLENGKYYVNQIINGYNDFDLLIFWFSKRFCSFYEETKSEFKKQYNPNILRVNPKKYPRVINKIKEILKGDYIEL